MVKEIVRFVDANIFLEVFLKDKTKSTKTMENFITTLGKITIRLLDD